jgi:hypothetical protein
LTSAREPTGTKRTERRARVVHADEGFFYLGAGISKNKVSEITDSGSAFGDLDKTSWKVLAGFRPIKLFAVEADYLDLGSQTNTFVGGGNSHSDSKAFAGYAVGFLPIPVPFLDVYGTAGSVPPGDLFSFSNQGTEFAWGRRRISATSAAGSSTRTSMSRTPVAPRFFRSRSF